MKELSLNILDVTENSVTAGATLVEIQIEESENTLRLIIRDNGCGMTAEIIKSVVNPFYTTRETRNVGLGIPLLKMAAEQTGGTFQITSATQAEAPKSHGTTVMATFQKDHLDFTPLGDIVATMTTLIQGHPDTDFSFSHQWKQHTATLDTRELREVLEHVPLNNYEVIQWITEYLQEQYAVIC